MSKLQFGCFKVDLRSEDGSSESVLCKPLTQAEFADGWQCVLPRRTKKSNVYNWNVTLAQLPPHLWSKCSTYYDEEGKENYHKINDGIYQYTVSRTDYDDEMVELHRQIHKTVVDRTLVRGLVENLKDNVSGWLLIRANKLSA